MRKKSANILAGKKGHITRMYNKRIDSATSQAQVTALKAARTRAHRNLEISESA